MVMGDLQVWKSELEENTAINRKKGMKTNDASQIVAYFFHLKMIPSHHRQRRTAQSYCGRFKCSTITPETGCDIMH